ncbi:FmdE family protein [Desulfosarcina ovata]|uniref:Formylmethanofuran dehydrogenase subunit E domain-containing protein n=1 Tax=Desulfosarcina ovata subsp. ovata TaxID=2752305 RepID=A0A5K8A5X9_9BACT|nr:FmdE family protein [Desulfosarcina ovata]BBO87866.1 hypothetical protein DSCOOX_10460 [Desulfosarcina ovata subsp. ovata]
MRKTTHWLFIVLVSVIVGFSGNGFGATFEKTVTQAMDTLNVTQGDSDLLVMTDAPFVMVDGANALPWLDRAQMATGCTVGKGNLLFFQRPQNHAFRLMLFKRSGAAVIVSREGTGWISESVDLGPTVISQPTFWKKTDDYRAGRDLFTLAAVANAWAKGAPYDFLKSAELHNHICPGLTSGYLMAHYILNHYPLSKGERYTVVSCPVWCKEDAFQVIMDCTPGKRGLVVKSLSEEQKANISIAHPAGMVLIWDAKKKSGKGVALSFDFAPLKDLSPKDTPKAAMVLAALEHLDQPDRFVSTAAEFQLDEALYNGIIQAGTNPYALAGLVKP